ncbi:MAG: translation initiation factor 4E [Edafosvirus sp.]|uniref:Translation initiation factor 4E n=1 Tax=Edafosvirus sp. TaxID=2487765 RepID=A0A3G4ZZG8_9VIRU|nr:MAG: translation initiation factor 4E [Edafosvirus sp.]
MTKQIDKKKRGKIIIDNDIGLPKSNRYDLFQEEEEDDKIKVKESIIVQPKIEPIVTKTTTEEIVSKTKTWAEKVKTTVPPATDIKPPPIKVPAVPINNNDPAENGSLMKLNAQWDLWIHEVDSKDWSLAGYQKLYSINNLSNFWSVFNNFNKFNLRGFHFFIMRQNVQPIWEDLNNRNGGVCSIKVDISKSYDTYTDLCMHTLNETIVKNMDDITGISFSPKNNWAIIKLWNRDKNNDISNLLLPELQQKYAESGIRYKVNMPEY